MRTDTGVGDARHEAYLAKRTICPTRRGPFSHIHTSIYMNVQKDQLHRNGTNPDTETNGS